MKQTLSTACLILALCLTGSSVGAEVAAGAGEIGSVVEADGAEEVGSVVEAAGAEEVIVKKKLAFSLQLGLNSGGIGTNKDLNGIPNVRVPDEATTEAFTGAIQAGYHAGVRVGRPLPSGDVLATGLEVMVNQQEFDYMDAGNFYIGVRRLRVTQWMLPLTYHLSIDPSHLFLKAGILLQYNRVTVRDYFYLTGAPDYTVHPLSFGPTLGIAYVPFSFSNGDGLGFYCDLYTGTRVYEDLYNKLGPLDMGSYFLSVGVSYHVR